MPEHGLCSGRTLRSVDKTGVLVITGLLNRGVRYVDTEMVGELRASHVIHLHRLLAAVRAEFEEDGFGDRCLEGYTNQGVAPADFKATKVEHERALMALSATLAGWASEQVAVEGDQTTPADPGTGEPRGTTGGETADAEVPAEPPGAGASQ